MKVVVGILVTGLMLVPAMGASLLFAFAGEPQSYWLWCTVVRLCN